MDENRFKNLIVLKILTKDDFTDPRIVSFMDSHTQFSLKEYDDAANFYTIFSERSKAIIEFFLNYKEGCLYPYKCNVAEPINEPFDPNEIAKYVRWLSQPGSAFYFKRKETNCKFEGAIENYRFSAMWEDRKCEKLIIAKAPQPEIMGEIMLFFNKRDAIKNKHDMDFFRQLIKDIGTVIEIAEYKIFDENEFIPIETWQKA